MFRRRSSSRHQPLNTTPSTSAQTAASRAYIANREANSNLSSAAAAAALRSHTPPPTSPGNVQTKRMLQRQLSNSSRGSTAGGLRHGSQPTLRRTPSSGSMTSRTFRDPSPGRSQSTSGATSRHHHPPVPPIPQHLPKSSTPSQRSVSVQPRRGTTSPLRTVSGRVASLDRGPSSMTASPTTPRNVSQGNSLELDRPPSRTSINFSYPMSARPNSPPQSPVDRESPRTSGEKSLTPPLLSPAESAGIQQSINSAANRKVKLKPKTAAPGSKEGSHFAHKTMGGRPTGTALQDEVENDEQDSHESASPQSPGVSTADFAPGHSVPVTEDRSPVAFEEDGITHIGRPKPKKRPSMVMEDHEGEELAEAAHAAQEAVAETPAVLKPTHPQTDNTSVKKPAREALVIYPPKSTQTAVSLHTRPSPSTSSTPSSPGERLMIDGNIDNQLPHRQSSTSPNRSARFSAQLTVGSESPLHEPPPRSVSPAKPALKNSSSPDRRIHLGQTPSEFSDATSVASDDGSRAGSKRRVAKVSFDDEAEVVGVAASPPTSPEPMNRAQSPVEKAKSRKWFGIGKKKTTSTDVAEDDDFESVLRPRPALPFFGSIRGMREPEEAAALSIDDNDSDSSSDDDFDSRDFGVSSDHAIGGILLNAHERANKTQQNPTNENLVPDFGSKDTQSEIPDEVETVKSTGGVNHLPTVQEEQRSTTSSEGTGTLPAQNTEVASKGETIIKQQVDGLKEPVPSIAIQPATPGAEPQNSIDLHNMPGGFPSYTSERVAAPEPSQQTPMKSPNPSNMPVQEPDSDGDDSGESIYSDAAEDPLDFQGDVFGSINAIVDSPLPPQAQLPKEAPESPTRTVVHPDPLTNLSEPVPSPSLEAINPRMPATPTGPTPAPSASSLKPVEEPQRRSPDPAESPWPLKTDATPSPAAHVQQESKAQSADPHQGSHLRKSLGKGDGEQQPLPNQSLRNTRPSSSAAAKPRRTQTASAAAHINDNPPRRQASKALPHSKTFPAAATMVSANDSDSDSSFKRTRRSSRIGASSQYTMKRTMRATRPMSTANSDTLVERTTSPPRTSSMRTTMRGPAPERSSGFPSLRDKSGRPRPRSSVLPSNTRSRISDSDYEGRGGRRFFQSRFADSSDEDEPMPSNLTPVRGIPRRKDTYDGESTDLDDSSDEETQREVRNGRNKATVQMTPEELEAILSQPKKKGGLFSRLRPPTRDSGKDGKVRKSFIESPARRDTPLERSRPELARMREDVMSPKLQKRHRGTSAFADTWPLNTEQSSALAGSAAHNTQNRPSTSDGIANGLDKDNDRPLFSRHGTSESIDSRVTSTASEAAIGRSGKKKRFPLLRRAFGLRD